jgi:hypothetical protein
VTTAAPTSPPPAATAAAPARKTEALPRLGTAIVQSPPATHATPAITPAARIEVTPATRSEPAQHTGDQPTTGAAVALHRHAVAHASHAATKHEATARLHLPAAVSGKLALPAALRARAAPVPAVTGRRDVLPAALALLALVTTSGCFLAVAARARRERSGV